MAKLQSGSFRLFRLFGIEVYLHWSWFLIAIWAIQDRIHDYHNPAWVVAEYLSLFAIVLTHEFGHALACRSVGGKAETIMLWPLGGIAFVNPPRRPGAMLWSIAAGPLVNVVLAPITIALYVFNPIPNPDLHHYLLILAYINCLLLVFNLLPIYPLDGGQIVRSILWFFIGEARSLMVAAIIGLIGAGAGLLLAFYFKDYWLIILAAFAAFQSWRGLQYAQMLSKMLSLPRRSEFTCPACGAHPPAAPLWTCPCGQKFDTFATRGVCPRCGRVFDNTSCPECHQRSPMAHWIYTGGFPIITPPPASDVYVVPTPPSPNDQ